MVHDLTIKKLLAEYLKTPESSILQNDFQLFQAPELLHLMEKSPDPGRFLELVMDYCSKFKRKDEGTFYTPQSVAEKMFNQAFKVFIKNNPDTGALLDIKVLDPSCGSGEFILAALKILLEKKKHTPLISEENRCLKFQLTNMMVQFHNLKLLKMVLCLSFLRG